MNVESQLSLGQSTSLLNGYRADVFAVPFTKSRKPALYEKPIVIKNPDDAAKWSWPIVSLLDNVEDLLSAVLRVKLRATPTVDDPSVWPAGALLLAGLTKSDREKALAALSDQLGVDLSKADRSFALVRRTRKVGTSTHPCYERGVFGNVENSLEPKALAALKSLEKIDKTSTDMGKDGANGYLDFYQTYGSHFISSVEAGDSIFQVFSYATVDYKNLVRKYSGQSSKLSGRSSPSFALFTTPKNDAGYGHTAEIGKVCIMSRDPALATTLADGLWLDKTYAAADSIFATYLRPDAVNVAATFQRVAVVSIELASLSVFAEYYRMLIWHDVFKGAMYVKYASGSGVSPYFTNKCPYDLGAVFKDSDPLGGDGLLSTLATPSVSVWQEEIYLNQITLQFPDLVEEFSVFASALQIPSVTSDAIIDVPGSTSVTLHGHVISSGSKGPKPPALRLSDAAFGEIKNRLFCGEFYGGLRIVRAGDKDSYVVMNGLMFEIIDGNVRVARDVRETPTVKVLTEKGLTDVQFCLVSAEARLNFLLAGNVAGKDESLLLMKRLLLWLAEVAGSHYQYQDEQLTTVQARAMYLATIAANKNGTGLPVPYLRYECYTDVVNYIQRVLQTASDKLTNFQDQVRERKAEERDVDRDNALNENIINSGKLLRDYIGTQASYQQSMEDTFSRVVEDKEEDLESALKKKNTLRDILAEQRSVVQEAITSYEEEVADWQKEESIKAVIDIASSLFVLGFTFVTPANTISDLQSLGETVQRIQKAMKVFDAIIQTYRAIKAVPSNPQQTVDALKTLGTGGLEMPTKLEWDEMKVKFATVLSTGPDVSAKASLSAAFEVLVLRGKALVQIQSTIQEIAADLSAAQQRIQLHKAQDKRLHDLKVDLDAKPQKLDLAKIDLVGLSGRLVFFQRQMLMTLASAIVIQDRALQYEYLRPPTPIGSFTLLNLQLAIMNQSRSINEGLTAQPQPTVQTHPIVYEIHGVKADSLINNHRYTFDIPPNKREFASYNYVRVISVDVQVGGIIFTPSGQYYTELNYDGNPFYDRDFDGEVLAFQTEPRIYTALHDVCSSKHDASDDLKFLTSSEHSPFSGTVSNVTPFSTWEVSLPKTKTNKDIKFDDYSRGVTLRIVFHVFAQLKETSTSPKEMYLAALAKFTRGDYVEPTAGSFKINANKRLDAPVNLPVQCEPGVRAAAAARKTTAGTSVVDVLRMMSGKSVCAGWDVVFSMTAKKINDQLFQQFNDRSKRSKKSKKFLRETGDRVYRRHTSEGDILTTRFNFKFKAPRLQFLLNNSNSAQVFLPIESGHFKYSDSSGGITTGEVKETDKSYVKGDVPLSIIKGSSQSKVVVQLDGGSFSAKHFDAGVKDTDLGLALTNYFTNLSGGYEVYTLGTLDFTEVTVLKSLTPTAFKFNIYHTESNRDILQLFIATTGRLQPSTALYLHEPIPSTYQSSLIVNSKIFFQDVLPASIGDGGIGLMVKLVEPENDDNQDKDVHENKAWAAEVTAGSVTAPFPKTEVDTELTSQGIGTLEGRFYIKLDDDTAVVDLTGMKFLAGDDASGWSVKMLYDVGSRTYEFKYGSKYRYCGLFSCDDWSKMSYSNFSVEVIINISTNLPLTISGTGQNQLVQIAATSSAVTGNLQPPAGACECDDRELQEMFLNLLKKNVTGKLVDVFNKPFNTVSLFAVKNLLFPAGNLINMKEAYVPGDMVIFGNFTSRSSTIERTSFPYINV